MPSIVATGSITIVDVLDGAKTGTLKLYRWAGVTAPALPTKPSTFNWTTGEYTYPAVGETADGWTATLPASSAPGQVLYSVEKPITDHTGSATSVSVPASFWTGTVARAVSSLSAAPLRCYSKASGSGLAPSGTATTADSSTYPAATSFGVTFLAAFTAAQPALGDNETLWISDGTQNPLTGMVTWATPYIATFKVGSLSALTIKTGALTVDNTLTIGAQGSILGGQTGFDTGVGFWLGYSVSDNKYKLSIGGTEITGITADRLTNVFTKANHGLTNGQPIKFSSVGSINNLYLKNFYWVRDVTANTFSVAEFQGGPVYDIAGTTSTVAVRKTTITWDGSALQFNAGLIDGAVYRSDSSGARVEIGGRNDIVIWDSTGAAVGSWNLDGNGALFLDVTNTTSWNGGFSVQNTSNASRYTSHFSNGGGGTAVYAISTGGTYGAAVESVSWEGTAIKATGGSTTIPAVKIATDITNGYSLEVTGKTKIQNSSPTVTTLLVSNTSSAIAAEISNVSTTQPALKVSTSSSNAIFATTAGPSAAVYGETTGTGNYTVGVEGRVSGNIATNSAYGVLGHITNASSGVNTFGVYGKNSGAGAAVVGEAAGSGIGGVFTATANAALEARGTLRATGLSLPTSGSGIELSYTGTIGYLVSYNRSTSTALPLHMISSETVLGGTTKVPATSTTAGVQGQIAWDTNFIYVCTATNVWRRAALSSW